MKNAINATVMLMGNRHGWHVYRELGKSPLTKHPGLKSKQAAMRWAIRHGFTVKPDERR